MSAQQILLRIKAAIEKFKQEETLGIKSFGTLEEIARGIEELTNEIPSEYVPDVVVSPFSPGIIIPWSELPRLIREGDKNAIAAVEALVEVV